MMFIWANALMLNNAIKMAEAMKPAKAQDEAPKTLKPGNWTRRTIPSKQHDI